MEKNITDCEKKDFSPYYERALDLQATKIINQAKEIAKMVNVHSRDIKNTKISHAFMFLLKVIIKKIQK